MVRMSDKLQSQSSMPLLSEPNRMQSVMKQITRNPNILRWRGIFSFRRKNNERVPLKTAIAEANNRSRLLDKIESLEDRLVQLSLEIESQRASRGSNTTSTLSGARELPVSSYPVFNNPKAKLEEQEKKQTRKNGNDRGYNRKVFKNGEKKGHGWPHLKLLGC